MIVNNHDIAGLHARMNRFIEEALKSVSSGTSGVNEFDQVRIGSYLDAVDDYRDWSVKQPHLDLPETHPRPISLEENPTIVDVENESINDIVRMFAVSRDELVNSQSARLGSGLISYDNVRLIAIIQKLRNFMESYVKKVTPLDLPESSPQSAESGPGRTGI